MSSSDRETVTSGSGDCNAAKRSVNDGLREDYPLMWEHAQAFDFAERLGGCTDPLMAEIDKAMRELHSARAYVREEHRG